MTTKKTDDKKHSKYGGSNSDRYLNCTAAPALEAQFPPQPAGAAADEGTLAHKCLEEMLGAHLAGETPLGIRKAFLKRLDEYPHEMVMHAWDAYCEITRRAPETAHLYSEQEVDASHFTIPGQFGSVDAAIVEEFGRLTVVDFKYGRGLVEAKDNTQLIYYALALSKKYHHNFAEVETVIIQPRAPHADGSVRSHVYPMDELLAWEEKFREKVKEAERGGKFNPGPWCKWCRGKPACGAHQDRKTFDAARAFGALTVPEKSETVKKLEADLPRLLNAFPLVEAYIEAVRGYAEEKLKAGGKIPGFCLEDKRGTRKWTSEKVAKEAQKTWGPRAFSKPELLSPSQLEEVLVEEYDRSAVKRWIDKRTALVSSGKKLAPISNAKNAKHVKGKT